jgi:23S rRNA pseudouridine1911/1915/1917 synthase
MTAKETTTTYTVLAPHDKGGKRLDRMLADHLPTLSRTRVKALIEEGYVVKQTVADGGPPDDGDGDAVRDPATRVRAGQVFAVRVPAPRPATPKPQALDLTVIHEDADLIVVDKPPGLVVHPAPGHRDGTLVNALLAHCGATLSGIGGVSRPGIVHRLDKDTSGLMVAAKNDTAHRALARQFAEHSVERAYFAVLWGVPRPRRGEIAGNIGRNSRNRKKMAVVEGRGKSALTRYSVIRTFADQASLVDCRLATGRTHQIRVHFAHLGHPVMGDALYGGGRSRRWRGRQQKRTAVGQAIAALDRQALHAYLIGFTHPISQDRLRFESDLPRDFNILMNILDGA